MAQYMPPEALGFLPHRETTELWLLLQAQIEVMLQHGLDYVGLSTDLKRAFNNIGRPQVFLVAEQIGLPRQLLRPWQKFLDQFVRRFDIQGCLGHPMSSNSGFPEGCPLSIVAMLNVNWCYHVYMKAFCPRVTSYSFVDNLTLAAKEALVVAQAYFALSEICRLFGLDTDADKTYVWALTRISRDLISQLNFPCLTDASELGGAMTFGRSRRTRLLRQRGQLLQPKWLKLRRSLAPGPQKLSVVSKVFWPKAFHGSSNVVVADNYAAELRKDAVKALKWNGAGVNPMLRLSLSDDAQADPGFYQIQLCIATFRRMLLKSMDLLPMWHAWFLRFDGHFLPGPFSRLLQCLSTIGWSIQQPPMVLDHEGHTWNLMLMDCKTLRFLLEDAWLQQVAYQAKHKTMEGLNGIDGFLTRLDCHNMNPLERSRLSALHSGAFMTNYEHAKFDAEKTPMCTMCSCEDDRQHWLRCPRFRRLRDDIPNWQPDNLQLPPCTLNHLLAPRQPCLVQWRDTLYRLQKGTFSFQVFPPKNGFHHLFLDGSCYNAKYHMLNLASWAVVNATTGQVVATAPLSGITQTIDRAELTALVAALAWSMGTELGLGLWIDSESTVRVAEFIQLHDQLPEGVANMDLWMEVLQALRDRGNAPTLFRWIPSHMRSDAAEDAYEDWVIHWNAVVDEVANFTNRDRPEELWRLHERAIACLDGWALRLRQLRLFYFSVAEEGIKRGDETVIAVPDDSTDDEGWLWISWEDSLPINWQVQCQHSHCKMPGSFLVQVVQWICAAERLEGSVQNVSDVELVFAFLQDTAFSFPFSLDSSLGLTMRTPNSLFQKPTLAMMLRPVQAALACLHQMFPSVVMRTEPRPRAHLGLYMKFAGVRLSFPTQLWQTVQLKVQGFTATRAVRRAADIARPAC